MARNFLGKNDNWAVVLNNVFPNSDLAVSTPVEFSGQRSGVYIEGNEGHLEMMFEYLKKLLGVYSEEKLFGRWIAITPPEDASPRIVLHYEAYTEADKIQLLNFILPKHLVKVCDFALSMVSDLIVKFDGRVVQKSFVVLPEEWTAGEVFLPKLVEERGVLLQ